MNYPKLRTRPEQFKALTSLTLVEFDELLTDFLVCIGRILCYTSRGTVRKNRLVLPASLPTKAHLLFFILSYLKLSPTNEHHGACFDMSQESANRWINLCLKALKATLRKQKHAPLRFGYLLASLEEKSIPEQANKAVVDQPTTKKKKVVEAENQYFIDATEIGINRPQDNDKQKVRYSKKKSKHAIKNTVITNQYTKILYLGNTYDGSVHDKKMIDEGEVCFPDDAFVWKDLGYVGYLPDNVHCFELDKKPRNGELTKEQKQENQLISSVRIVVEHAIAGLKRCRILKDKMRIKIDQTKDTIIEICAGLHNLRLKHRNKYKCNELFVS